MPFEPVSNADSILSVVGGQIYSFFMQAPAPMVILTGEEYRFLLANPLYEKYVGRQVVGKTLAEAFSPEEINYYLPIMDRVYRTGEPYVGRNLPLNLLDENGLSKPTWIDISYSPFRDHGGKVTGLLVFIQDVTEAHNAKVNMEAYNFELKQAKAEAERMNKMKSAFLANMSHEIRTPLGAILGFADILRSPDLSDDERANYIEVISRNGHALTKIIDDILDLSKIEAGKLELDVAPVCLFDLTRDVVSMFGELANAKGISLIFDKKQLPPFKIDSDAVRIRQVLVNLIGNAIKFTSKGSVEIKMDYEDQLDGFIGLNYRIIDTGIGMSREIAEGLFQPFTQADSFNSRKFGGTGLGLALSRKLSQALGGDIVIETCEENNGCTFKFTFRARKNLQTQYYAPAARAPQASAKPLAGCKILVVDDSFDNRALLEIYLKRAGAEVTLASDGMAGVREALENNFDIVLMDIQMPGIDGYEALSMLSEHHYTKPVLALTAHAMKEERERALKAGFNDHVAKPVDLQLLQNSILAHTLKIR
ncbi:MAG: response regulator [Pseudobdellovibrio sp.]